MDDYGRKVEEGDGDFGGEISFTHKHHHNKSMRFSLLLLAKRPTSEKMQSYLLQKELVQFVIIMQEDHFS